MYVEQTWVVYLIVWPSVGRGFKTRRCISRQEDGF